jgi:hypothetical protein
MSIFSKRDKNGRFESDKESDNSSIDDSKTVSTPSESVLDDDSLRFPGNASKPIDKPSATANKSEPSKMDNAREVFLEMFSRDGIQRKDIILAFQSDRVKLTKAGAGTYYAKLKREHLDNVGDSQ